MANKYTVIIDGVEKVIQVTKHHTAADFAIEVLKATGGLALGSVWHHYVDRDGNERATKVR